MKRIPLYIIIAVVISGLQAQALSNKAAKLARLDSIRTEIKKTKADWQADTSRIFLLPEHKFIKMLGALAPDTTSLTKWEPREATKGALALPDSFDWRDETGRDWTTSVKSQDTCGSCWAFASIGAWEAYINIALDSAEYDLDLSEQQLVSCASPTWGCNGGSFAATYLTDTGAVCEACFPYAIADLPCSDKCAHWRDSILYRASGTQYVVGGPVAGIDNIKTLVMEHPTYTSMDVYQDFQSYSGGVYEHTSGPYQGGHAVVIIGWNDAKSCWICKNSWDTDWGEDGFFRIKYLECDIGDYGYRFTGLKPRLLVESLFDVVTPPVGNNYRGLDSVIIAHSDSTTMGSGDTVYEYTGAYLDRFRGDTTFSSVSFSFTLDGESTLEWQWDTITGVPKVDVYMLASHNNIALQFESLDLLSDTSLEWMAESTVTISTDSYQTLQTSPTRRIIVAFDHWSDGMSRSHDVTLSASGPDTFIACFNIDTVQFIQVFESNIRSGIEIEINGIEISLPHSTYLDSAATCSLIANDREAGFKFYTFNRWEPWGISTDTTAFSVDSFDTIEALYNITGYRTYFTTDFGCGAVEINSKFHDAAHLQYTDSAVAIDLGIIDSQALLGNIYVFSVWSDSIPGAHSLRLDTCAAAPLLIAHHELKSHVTVTSPFGTPNFTDSIALSQATLSAEIDSTVPIDPESRHKSIGWERVWTNFDTLLYSGFDTTEPSEQIFPPFGWENDDNDCCVARYNEYDPFCLPQNGDRFCSFRVGYKPADDPCFLISDTFLVPIDADSSELWFWMLESDSGTTDDTLFLLISDNYGGVWAKVGAYSRESDSIRWSRREYNLSAYAGDELMIKFEAKPGGFSGKNIELDNVFAWAARPTADTGDGSIAEFAPAFSCSVNFLWLDQYLIVTESEHGTPTGAGWYFPDSSAVIAIEDSVPDGPWRYFFSNWSGVAIHTAPVCSFTVTTAGTAFARWDTSVFLTTNTAHDTVKYDATGDPWYALGSTAKFWITDTIEYVDPLNRWLFDSWSGDYPGSSDTGTLIMDAPKAVTANWLKLSKIDVYSTYGTPTGAGWYYDDSSATVSVEDSIQVGDSLYLFAGWEGLLTDTDNPLTFTVDTAGTLYASWDTLRRLDLSTEYCTTGADEEWYRIGDTARFWITDTVVYESPSFRHHFAGWAGGYSGTEDTATIVIGLSNSISAVWLDQYRLILTSEHGAPAGAGWYCADSMAIISVPDSIFDTTWLYRFAQWNDAKGYYTPACTISVTAAGSMWATWDTLLRVVIAADNVEGTVIIDGADTAAIWAEWLEADATVNVDAIPTCSTGIDSQIVFIDWSDGSTSAHDKSFTHPETLWAHYRYQFLCTAQKSPATGLGWIALTLDTGINTSARWTFSDSMLYIACSDSDTNFVSGSTWVFTGFSDGLDTAHWVGPVVEPLSITANYSGAELELYAHEINPADEPSLHVYAHPNPFKSQTKISCQTANQSEVTIEFFDIFGKRVSKERYALEAGDSYFLFEPTNLPAGLYLYRLSNGITDRIEKIIYLK